MSLNFQNKIIFPAPENSYTTETAYGQVIYVPRDIMKRANQRARQGYPAFKLQTSSGAPDQEEAQAGVEPGYPPTLPPMGQMTYIDKSDLHSLAPDCLINSSATKGK